MTRETPDLLAALARSIEKAREARTAAAFAVGDTVRVGTGRTDWTITEIWSSHGERFAQVARVGRPDVRMSYPIERLKPTPAGTT